jgi:superfamily II DNA or RNA helicase
VTIGHFFKHKFNKFAMKFETGSGKTTLGLLLILQTSLKQIKSFAVNHSVDLCKQSIFFIDKPVQVSEGDVIEGTIKFNAHEENYRNLFVKFSYNVRGKGGSQAEECFTFE